VHREVAAEAACYFPRFSAEALADNVVRLAANMQLKTNLAEAGRQRSAHFSWKTHVEQLLDLAFSIQQSPRSKAATNAA